MHMILWKIRGEGGGEGVSSFFSFFFFFLFIARFFTMQKIRLEKLTASVSLLPTVGTRVVMATTSHVLRNRCNPLLPLVCF